MSYGPSNFSSVLQMLQGASFLQSTIAMSVCAVLALAGGIVAYFLFLSPKNEHRFTGFLDWLYQFLHFRKLLLEALLKISYIVVALYFTLYSLYLLFTASFLAFLITFIGSNLLARLVYEFLLFFIMICRNTSEINGKLSGPAVPAQPQTPAAPAEEPPAPPAGTCPNCGTVNEPADAFCGNCGHKLH